MGIRSTLSAWRKSFERKVLILLYHRVDSDSVDPWSLCVTPERFEEHLEVLQRKATVLKVHEMVEAVKRGALPRRSVAITFDDGYADNLLQAKPRLDASRLAATFFITTGFIGGHREFWWDEVEQVLLRPGVMSERVAIRANGRHYEWTLEKWVRYTDEDQRAFGGWRASQPSDPTVRHTMYRELYPILQAMDVREREAVIDSLFAQSSLGKPKLRPSHRTLTREELRTLAGGDGVEIGAHTVTHPRLPMRPATEQEGELRSSRAWLESELGGPVRSVSFPYGAFDDTTVNLARAAGFESACTCVETCCTDGSDLFRLPRVVIESWDGAEFERRLDRWFSRD